MFTGYEDGDVMVWDLLASKPQPAPIQHLVGHSARVTCLQMNPRGDAVATGSWDTDVQVGVEFWCLDMWWFASVFGQCCYRWSNFIAVRLCAIDLCVRFGADGVVCPCCCSWMFLLLKRAVQRCVL